MLSTQPRRGRTPLAKANSTAPSPSAMGLDLTGPTSLLTRAAALILSAAEAYAGPQEPGNGRDL